MLFILLFTISTYEKNYFVLFKLCEIPLVTFGSLLSSLTISSLLHLYKELCYSRLFCFDYISFDISCQSWWTSFQINKWTVPATSIAPQVRSLRKGNNDQVAIAIDMDPGSSGRLEDEDDDKGKPRIINC